MSVLVHLKLYILRFIFVILVPVFVVFFMNNFWNVLFPSLVKFCDYFGRFVCAFCLYLELILDLSINIIKSFYANLGVTKDGRELTQEEMETGVSVTRVRNRKKTSIMMQNGNGENGDFIEDDEYFDEEDEEEYFSEDYDSEFDEDDYYDDDAEIVDLSRRASRFKFDSRGRKIGLRGRGNHPRLQGRFRRKYCGHKPGTEEYERAKLGRSR